MKHTQDVFFTGYVTILVRGERPELLFNKLSANHILVWDIRKVDAASCEAKIKRQDCQRIRHIRRGTGYKVYFRKKQGIPFLALRFLQKKPLLISLFLAAALIFLLSNTVWQIEVEGVDPELEHEIEEKLNDYGVKLGAFKLSLDTPVQIQQRLLHDIPELLWIGVTENGTTFSLEGVPKTRVEREETADARHIVAAKQGVVVDMFVSEGEPQVSVHDFVEPGDILVSGLIGKEPEAVSGEDDKQSPDTRQSVAATGEVIARTWYNSEVTVPLEETYTVLTGDKKTSYKIQFGNTFRVPIWGFGKSDFDAVQKEELVRPLRFLQWELPIGIVKTNEYEQMTEEVKRTTEEAAAYGADLAAKDLQLELGKDADIISQKILHQAVENGKVKLIFYFQVNEDIASYQPISQGD